MEPDELALQHMMPSRPESPALEIEGRKAIEVAFRQLVEHKTLYQKVEVDLHDLEKALAPIGQKFINEFGLQQKQQGLKSASMEALTKIATTEWEKRKSAALTEVAQRPWALETRHHGDDPQLATIHLHAKIGGQPVGTPSASLNLHFYLPSVQLLCGKCKTTTSFVAHVGSTQGGFGNPFTGSKAGVREQVFLAFYRCEICKERVHSVLVQRRGLKLHLCGFAPRREQKPSRGVPTALIPILLDAENAVAEGDVSAGFYHLRTLLEHYLKTRQGLEMTARIRGEELLEAHYKSLPEHLRSSLPSLSTAFNSLSEYLHARTGGAEDYIKLSAAVCDHIEALALLERYNVRS